MTSLTLVAAAAVADDSFYESCRRRTRIRLMYDSIVLQMRTPS